MSVWLNIIGLGEDGLDALPQRLRTLVDQAELIVGGARHLAMAADAKAEKQSWAAPLSPAAISALARSATRRASRCSSRGTDCQ